MRLLSRLVFKPRKGRKALIALLVAMLCVSLFPARAHTIVPASCSSNAGDATSITFINDSSRSISVYWIDNQCQEHLYNTLAPADSYTQPTYAGHVWQVRDTETGAILREVSAPSSTPLTVRIVDQSSVYLPFASINRRIAERATTDRPDDTTDYQIHVMYVLPSDGLDRALDTNSALKMSLAAMQKWMRQQTNGRAFRFDTYQGTIDITFARLSRTDAEIAASGVFVRDEIEKELNALGFTHPKKLYAVYYDGSSTSSCGAGPWPPDLIGNVTALYLHGAPPGAPACDTNHFATSIDHPGYWEFVIAHEIIHGLGFVAKCAPHAIPGNQSHVSDDPRDLMYAGPLGWQPSILDIGRDDYFEHNNAGCLDLAKSAFLDPSAPDAAPPPGWS